MTFRFRCFEHQHDRAFPCPRCPDEPPLKTSTPAPALDAKPLDTQVGGGHYKKLGIQPVEYIHANGLPFIEGSVIKYVTRWRDKGGLQDIDKAIHFLQLLKDLEAKKP